MMMLHAAKISSLPAASASAAALLRQLKGSTAAFATQVTWIHHSCWLGCLFQHMLLVRSVDSVWSFCCIYQAMQLPAPILISFAK
jgi:hypothetical protein